jgi:hypothetical protein
MSINRIAKESLFLRREFTADERLEMGRDLAQAHNRIAAIADEETSMKAVIKEKKAGVELTIGSLSRKLNDGYEMETVSCDLVYDTPNIGEVTYLRPGGAVAKVRAMTVQERQEELPFDKDGSGPVVVVPAEQSAANIAEFFEKPGEPSAADLDAVAEERVVADATALPDTFESDVRQSMGVPEPLPATLEEQLKQAESMGSTSSVENLLKLAEGSLAKHKKIGASILQRELHVSYVQAAHLIDKMQDQGLIDKDGNRLAAKTKSGPKDLAAEHAKQTEEGW